MGSHAFLVEQMKKRTHEEMNKWENEAMEQ